MINSARIEVDLDARAFSAFAREQGFGDGLPCIAPTETLVAEYLDATTRSSQEVVALLPPTSGPCTIEKIAINAAMAGAPPDAMPLLCASIEAMADPDFYLAALNATTAPVVPALIVNGDIRHRLSVPFRGGCFGGGDGNAASIGRAIRLIMRNVGGQHVGVTSECVFGQPGRVVGMVVGEWEEQSPWAPLGERQGVPGDAVTAFATMGTANICDTVAGKGRVLLELMGKSMAYLGSNNYLAVCAHFPGQVAVAINPIWANEIIARDVPSIEDVQMLLWEHASQPISSWPADYRQAMEDVGRVKPDGRVHLVASPEDIIVFVCGGLGALHATMLHGFGHTVATTAPVRGSSPMLPETKEHQIDGEHARAAKPN